MNDLILVLSGPLDDQAEFNKWEMLGIYTRVAPDI